MFDQNQKAYIAIAGEKEIYLHPDKANRHGLITGATGTGKTVTLQNLAETFSAMGVPVFAADIKGDLSGVANKGGNKESVTKRVESYRLPEKGFAFQAFPVQFWDVFGEQGVPVRATVSEMGATLFSRLLQLNDVQSGVLSIIFKIAGDEGMELIDLKDLRKTVEFAGSDSALFTTRYGNISTASIGAIQRGLLQLEQEGAEFFLGEPSLNLDDLLQTSGGKGAINILAADKLINSPKTYAIFLLWMLSKLYETLPEIGDPEKPRLIFFFDEAHLLFNGAPKALVEKIEQIVRLIRSKGVGVYFVTQSPADIPDTVLAQLGNRIQHALHAYTPKEQKALKVAAQSFRANPAFDTEKAISELGTGEALVSFLDERGAPQPVERAFILPPEGQIGPITPEERQTIISGSLLYRHYGETADRESAYEKLTEKQHNRQQETDAAAKAKDEERYRKEQEKLRKAQEKENMQAARQRKKMIDKVTSEFLIPIGKQLLKSFYGKKKK